MGIRHTAIKSVGADKRVYDSKFEASYANDLHLLKKAKHIKDYEPQVKLPLNINGYNIGSYTADFIVHHLDGSKEIVETKGYATPVFRLRWKIVEALYQDKYKCTCVFQGKGKLSKIKKMKKYARKTVVL